MTRFRKTLLLASNAERYSVSVRSRYNILFRIIRTANDHLDPSKVMRIIMGNIQKLIPCEAGSILLMSPGEDELRFERARGQAAEAIASARLKVGERIDQTMYRVKYSDKNVEQLA